MNIFQNRFLFLLVCIGAFIRVITSMLFTDPPNIPHDFSGIILYGESFLNGTLYTPLPGYGVPSQYGPLFSMVIAGWIVAFGKSFYLLKIPYIIFDLANIVLLYYIVKELVDEKHARYVSVLFTFSYVPLVGVVHGSTNMFFMTFLLLAVWLLFRGRLGWSAVALAMSIGFKAVPLVAVPVILWYVWQKKGSWKCAEYGCVVGLIGWAIVMPFYLSAGRGVLFPYLPNSMVDTVLGSNFLTLYHYLDYFFNYGVSTPYESYVFPNWVATPFMVGGFLLAGVWIWKVRWENKEIELVRNIFLLVWAGLMFGRIFYSFYLYWLWPFVLVLAVWVEKEKFDWDGALYTVASIVVTASIYRWAVEYSTDEMLFIMVAIVWGVFGAWLMFGKSRFTVPLTMLVGAAAMESQIHVYVLTLVGFDRKWAWGIEAFGVNVLMVVGMILLLCAVERVKYARNNNGGLE